MDRRSWPWKKKSSGKADKAAAASEAPATTGVSHVDQRQESYKKPKHVQISVEQFSHLTGLEEQFKTYEEQVKSYEEQAKTYEKQVQTFKEQVQTHDDQVQTYENQVQTLEYQINGLNEKLDAANADITTKENLVKQHSKVAEDAVSGWEKAEAEALALKSSLESVTLSKLTAEDQAAHLDGALKECMRQIRNLKEEHEQQLHDIVLTKTKQMEKMKLEFEKRNSDFEQELLRSAADIDALSRTLQERSNLLVKINEEKSRAEAEIELFKGKIDLCEREINSLKYELHVVSKELEIRSEEKNMSLRSAEAANKHNMEGMKKIAKLEAECQRLRGLVRKKLPGPAALAQMKLEVENLGKDHGDTRLKRSPVKSSSPRKSISSHSSAASDFNMDNAQKLQKENEFLTERLLAMEEETKMLKEALAKRNSELQESRTVCAQTASKLQSLEAEIQQKGPPKSTPEVYSSQNTSNPPSLTSMSEDGNDDVGAGISSTALSQAKEKDTVELNKAESVSRLELMDDFLEMEKLACLPNDSNANVSANNIDRTNDKKPDMETSDVFLDQEKQSNADQPPLMRLQSRISKVLVSVSNDADVEKVLGDIKFVIQDLHDNLNQQKHSDIACNWLAHPEDNAGFNSEEIVLSRNIQLHGENFQVISQELADAISQIHEFVHLLGKEARIIHVTSSEGEKEFNKKLEEFSVTFNQVLCGDQNLVDFIFNLSHILTEANELKINVMSFSGTEVEIPSTDCIDKVALPESKILGKDSSGEKYQNGCANISDPAVPEDGHVVSGSESNARSCDFTLEDFQELKSEKEMLDMDLETTKSQLRETEQLLADVRLQMASVQKSNSLAETQLKCMTESYRLLETHAVELETEVKDLREKIENLENELEDEKRNLQGALFRCKELEEQLQRNGSSSAESDDNDKSKQERELAAAAEKLAECQETIFLLGKQLKGLRPQPDKGESPNYSSEDEAAASISRKHGLDIDQPGTDGATSPPQSPYCTETNRFVRSPIGPRHGNQWHTGSSSSSSSSTPTPEKPSKGFSRFFSSK